MILLTPSVMGWISGTGVADPTFPTTVAEILMVHRTVERRGRRSWTKRVTLVFNSVDAAFGGVARMIRWPLLALTGGRATRECRSLRFIVVAREEELGEADDCEGG